MAGAKSDLNKNERVNEEEERKFAEKINALFQKTSAKENSGIDKLFESISKKIYEKYQYEWEKNLVSKLNQYFSY